MGTGMGHVSISSVPGLLNGHELRPYSLLGGELRDIFISNHSSDRRAACPNLL